jgi:hypothetical protein
MKPRLLRGNKVCCFFVRLRFLTKNIGLKGWMARICRSFLQGLPAVCKQGGLLKSPLYEIRYNICYAAFGGVHSAPGCAPRNPQNDRHIKASLHRYIIVWIHPKRKGDEKRNELE